MEKKGAEDKYSGNKAGNKTEESSISTQRYPNMSKPRRNTSDLVVLQQKKLLPVGIARPKQWHNRNLCVSLQGKRALQGGAGAVSLSALPTDTAWGPGTDCRCHGGSSAAAGPRARPGWPGQARLPSWAWHPGDSSHSPAVPRAGQPWQGTESCCWHRSTATAPGTALQALSTPGPYPLGSREKLRHDQHIH